MLSVPQQAGYATYVLWYRRSCMKRLYYSIGYSTFEQLCSKSSAGSKAGQRVFLIALSAAQGPSAGLLYRRSQQHGDVARGLS